MPRTWHALRQDLEDRWLQGTLPVRPILSVVASGYAGILAVRGWLYRHAWLRQRRLPVRVIGVGNITLGGTGKTVMVAHLAQSLRDRGLRVAILSRGYRRRGGGVRVVSEGQGPLLPVEETGDEPFLLARALHGVPVVVGADRYEAGRIAVERFHSRYLLLDDAFQNLAVAKDLEILLVNARNPWGGGQLFPAGVLREPLHALRRADWIILTRAGAEPDDLKATIRRYNPLAPILRARYRPSGLVLWGGGNSVSPDELSGRRCLAFAAIADPASFRALAEESGAVVLGLHPFPDHHPYTVTEMRALEASARAVGAEALITTEKDAVRLPRDHVPEVPVWIFRIRLELLEGEFAWRELLRRIEREAG